MSWHISKALAQAYENSLCLQAPAAGYSEESSSDGRLFAPSNGSHTPQAFLSPDRMKAFSRLSQFGMTCKPLTAGRGEDVLTWYLAGFPAKTLAQPVKAQELTESGVECGHIWPESFARWDRNTSSWKTVQCSLLANLDEFSETWPRWGIMRDGACLEASTLEPRIIENEFEFVPTPLAQDGTNAGGIDRTKNGRFWNLRDWYRVTMKTPSGKHARSRKRAFWEWLMGWPENWTALSALETDKFRQWLRSHGKH